jgi:hypothetical protein
MVDCKLGRRLLQVARSGRDPLRVQHCSRPLAESIPIRAEVTLEREATTCISIPWRLLARQMMSLLGPPGSPKSP